MKAVLILIAAIMIGSTTYAKSAIPSFITKENLAVVDKNTAIWGDTLPVPMTIRTSFNTKYPNASSVTWYKYNPGTMKVEPGMWYSTLDPSDYYVTFVWDNADYVAWYDNGTWIRSSKQIDNSDLPDAVSRVISSQYPGFIITDVDYETDQGQSLYEVKLEKGNTKWNLHVNDAGAIVKKKERTMSPAQVNAAIMSDFDTRFPNASGVVWYAYTPDAIVEVVPTDWDYNMDASDYQVRFTSDGTEYVAYYDNGMWVRSESYTFDASKLPSTVNNAINREYSGYTIKDVDREDNVNQILYEVELQKGNDKCKIHYAADGSVVKKRCRVDGVKTKS